MFKIITTDCTNSNQILHNISFDDEKNLLEELKIQKKIYRNIAEEMKKKIKINVYFNENLRKGYEFNYEV